MTCQKFKFDTLPEIIVEEEEDVLSSNESQLETGSKDSSFATIDGLVWDTSKRWSIRYV